MSLFQRYLRHRAPGSTQDDALVQRYLPLDAGRATWLENNCQHLAEQNPRRALRQHPGVRDFYATAMSGSGFTDPPTTSDIQWATSQKDGACVLDLGQFYAWPLPNGALPRIHCEFTTAVEGGHTLGWVLAVSPGGRGPLSAVAQASGTTTSATYTAVTTAFVDLGRGHLAPASYGPANGVSEVVSAEAGQLPTFRVFLGAYCSSGTDASGSRASIAAISLYAEQP